jgi:hypothetical protein
MINQIESVAIIVFAILFIGVGLYRLVEFKGVGLPVGKQRWLMALHVTGTLLFGVAFISTTFPVSDSQRIIMFSCFIAALIFIAPGQFTLGMIHRRVNEKRAIAEGRPILRREPLIVKLFKKKKKR